MLQWSKLEGCLFEEVIIYILEIQEDENDNFFYLKYIGEDLICIVKNFKRSIQYKFRLIVFNMEGKSCLSEVFVCMMSFDRFGFFIRLFVKGLVIFYGFSVKWDFFKDNGGLEIFKYLLEIIDGNFEVNQWEVVYSGLVIEYIFIYLKLGILYKF